MVGESGGRIIVSGIDSNTTPDVKRRMLETLSSNGNGLVNFIWTSQMSSSTHRYSEKDSGRNYALKKLRSHFRHNSLNTLNFRTSIIKLITAKNTFLRFLKPSKNYFVISFVFDISKPSRGTVLLRNC